MAYKSMYDGILFVEGNLESATRLNSVQTSLTGSFSAHLKNLDDVKSELAFQAKRNDCNCVLDFKYGQKHRLFAIDDVYFYGSGVLA
ncbi:MAG: hypothetical protein GX778_06085, partial [Erysipelothrix sp.]|nr:hypothetical protein [Erysipelothrix sp.]